MKTLRAIGAVWIGICGASLLIRAAGVETPPPTASSDSGDEAVKMEGPGTAKFWAAMKHLKSKVPAETSAGRSELEAAAALEFTPAQLVLGEYYQVGASGFVRSPKKAAGFFRLAAERGNGFAMVSYGLCLFSGNGVRKDAEKATEWLQAALAPKADFTQPKPPEDFLADSGAMAGGTVAGGIEVDPSAAALAKAHLILGVILEGKKKLAEAQTHYVAAATAGSNGRAGLQLAAVQAGVNFAFGRGVPRDPTKANEMLAQAKALGRRTSISVLHDYATAKLVDDFAVSEIEEAIAKESEGLEGELQLNIARQFTDKKSKDYDPKAAVRWFELAAESGKEWAMLELAFLYSHGDVGAPEPEKAFQWIERAGGGETPKHFLGVENLVICKLHGIGTARDEAAAMTLAKKFRDDDLVCYLATIGQCPAKVITFEEMLELNRTWAKERKDPHAQYLLARRYLYGWGVKSDGNTARSWLEKAVKGGSPAACRELGIVYQERWWAFGYQANEGYRKAVELYRRGADGGDAAAAKDLAFMYEKGWGVDPDVQHAEMLYKKCLEIDPTFAAAQNSLGGIYERRWQAAVRAKDNEGTERNRKLMLDCYESADRAGFAFASNNLGRLYYEGALGQKDYQKAYVYFENAAEHGLVIARFRLGQMHEKGEGVEVTPTEAAYHYRLAALDGHTEALKRLVVFYIEGKGGAQDFERASFWLDQLVRRGEVGALATAADVLLRQGKYEDAVKILEWLRDNGRNVLRGFACERLSVCYLNGLGVKIKPAKAKSLLDEAFALGNADATEKIARARIAAGKFDEGLALLEKASNESAAAAYELGQMYYFGQHVGQDKAKALLHLRKAGELREVDALYFMAGMTLNQDPAGPTLDEAIGFAQAAEAMGHGKAGNLRERLEKRRREQLEKQEAPTAGARST
jgi:TPR repeat protein